MNYIDFFFFFNVNQCCISGINSIWSLTILLLYCWVLFAKFLFTMIASVFTKNICSFLVIPFPGFGVLRWVGKYSFYFSVLEKCFRVCNIFSHIFGRIHQWSICPWSFFVWRFLTNLNFFNGYKVIQVIYFFLIELCFFQGICLFIQLMSLYWYESAHNILSYSWHW